MVALGLFEDVLKGLDMLLKMFRKGLEVDQRPVPNFGCKGIFLPVSDTDIGSGSNTCLKCMGIGFACTRFSGWLASDGPNQLQKCRSWIEW